MHWCANLQRKAVDAKPVGLQLVQELRRISLGIPFRFSISGFEEVCRSIDNLITRELLQDGGVELIHVPVFDRSNL